jgi:hypothetical protein
MRKHAGVFPGRGRAAARARRSDPCREQCRLFGTTHIKLIEGESLADLAPLVGMVGKARVESVRPLARW